MISIIVAASDNNVIGRANSIPWRLSRDLKNFKTLTTGHACIMGRKTYESIVARLGKPLPDRRSIVISHRSERQSLEGVTFVSSWEGAVQAVSDDTYVIGGATVYADALGIADRLNLTRVHTQVDGDVMFPTVDFSKWKLIHEEQWPKDEKNEYDATYQIYERIR